MQKKNNASSGYGKQVYPTAMHVNIYMTEKGFTEKEATTFLQTMLLRRWRTKTGRPVKNWKQYLFQWQYILKHLPIISKRKCTRNRKLENESSSKPNILDLKGLTCTFLDRQIRGGWKRTKGQMLIIKVERKVSKSLFLT